jgi:carbonic anhydrase
MTEIDNTQLIKGYKCSCHKHCKNDDKKSDDVCALHVAHNPDSLLLYDQFYSVARVPISIHSEGNLPIKHNLIHINYDKHVEGYYFNTGQAIEFHVNNHQNSKSHVVYENNKYYLKQFHFHAASENTIDNQFWPMEIHFVNEYINDAGISDIVVIALLVHLDYTNKSSAKDMRFTQKAFDERYFHKEIHVDLTPLNDLPNRQNTYYSFYGTFTSPLFPLKR